MRVFISRKIEVAASPRRRDIRACRRRDSRPPRRAPPPRRRACSRTVRRQRRRRRLLPHLLAAALQRAFALEAMDRRRSPSPSTCTSMWRARSISLLEIERRHRRRRPAPRRSPAATAARTPPRSRAMRMPRPPPPAAALIITGKPIALDDGARRVEIVDAAVAAGHRRHAGLRRDLRARATLSPIRRIVSAFGPTKISPACVDRFGESGILGEEAVARMDRIGARSLAPPRGWRRCSDRTSPPAAGRSRPPRRQACTASESASAWLCACTVRDAELARRADDAHRDLAAIGDEERSDRHVGRSSALELGERLAGLHRRPRSRRGTARSCRRLRLHLVERSSSPR